MRLQVATCYYLALQGATRYSVQVHDICDATLLVTITIRVFAQAYSLHCIVLLWLIASIRVWGIDLHVHWTIMLQCSPTILVRSNVVS